ncbi:hypothetical protein [Streptomyces lutosisoli]|uniref:Uncharacterized protein n=1 Tax=Streptomyces lutosisoli TaxID=2665721 RepID=A0ABW2VVE5_9ACTN
MSRPVKTTSYMSPVWFPADLPREAALENWAGPQAQIAGRLPNMAEYVQRRFSPTDQGYRPSSPSPARNGAGVNLVRGTWGSAATTIR